MQSYRVRVLPAERELEVELTLGDLDPDAELDLACPSWVPGAYGFMMYGRDIFSGRALDTKTGAPIATRRHEWTGWRVGDGERCGSTEVLVKFVVSATDPAWGELAGLVDGDFAVLLATRYLARVKDGRILDAPCRVTYELPEGWEMHHPSGATSLGERTWEYPTWRLLLDTPVVAAKKLEKHVRVCRGTTFHHVFLSKAIGFEDEVDGLLDGVMAVTDRCHDVFGSFPFEDYTFIFACDPRFHWGLEHANATMIGLGENVFIDPEERLSAIRVSGHELVHAWNVCRLKPHGLDDVDPIRGSFTEGLWIAEGITRYYEFLLAVRGQTLSVGRFFSNIGRYYRAVTEQPAYGRTSLTDSSLATFLNHNLYPGSVNTTIDYYSKGLLVAFDMDAILRTSTPPSSLDAEFRAFYEAFITAPRGYTTADAIRFFGERVPAMKELLEREVTQPGGLSTPTCLERLGFELVTSPVRQLGVVLKENKGPKVQNVLDDSPAGKAGLAPDDEIVRMNGFTFTLKGFKWLAALEAEVVVEVRRGHQHRVLTMKPTERREVSALTWRGDELQLAALQEWLGRPEFTIVHGETIPFEFYDNFHGTDAVL
jgi:predicted metalloprotease with PDZ domain